MKYVALSLAVSFAAIGHASFEMMLIADNTNGVIHRYDPVNRVYLGSFGQGSLLPVTSMALDQTRGRVYVKQTNFLTAFDYATGEALFSSVGSVGAIAYREGFGDLITATASGLTRATVTLTGIGTSNLYTASVPTFAQVTTNGSDVFVANPAAGNIIKFSGSLTATTTVGSPVSSGLNGDTIAGMMTSQSGAFHFALSATDRRYYATSSLANSVLLGSTSTLTTTTAITRGHGEYGYYLGATATGFGIQKFFENGINFQNFTQVALPSQIGAINSAVTVVAPEPGSMIALGIGVAALLRKRKNKG
jgi:hypothetical protein